MSDDGALGESSAYNEKLVLTNLVMLQRVC